MNTAEFWTALAPILADYRTRSYEFWLQRVEGDPICFEFHAKNGVDCQVEISVFWDDRPDADIRVIFSIDDGGRRAFLPVTDCFIMALDGTFVGEQERLE